jgi:RNA polymerase sigma-70 factor (ECF subfamily)
VRRAGSRREAGDDALVTTACAGDADALTTIWTQYAPLVQGYLRGHGATDPEDLTSEVFLALFGRIQRFRGSEADLRSFIFTIAHHRLVDDRRRGARQPTLSSYDPTTDRRETASAEHVALGELATDRARELIDALPAEQRDVMLLRIIGDLTLEQTAEVLGKRVGAVKAAQHRALVRLRKSVGEAVSP